MEFYFTSVLLLIFGGIISIFINKDFKMKFCAIISFLSALFVSYPAINSLLSGKILQKSLYLSEFFPDVNFVIDPLSAFFILVISYMSFFGILYAIGYIKPYLENKNSDISSHSLFLMLLVASMLSVVVIQNAFIFLIAWEIMSLSSFFLVIFESEKKDVLKSGIKYLVYMHISVIFILSAFVILNLNTGSLDFSEYAKFLKNNPEISNLVFLLSFIGFGTKAGFIPFHNWLPEAHPKAPSHISGIMSGVMIKTGIYGILRTIFLLWSPSKFIAYFVLTIGIISALWGVLYAISQHDIKKLLAYHSIENIGIIGIGLGIGLLGAVYNNPVVCALGFAGGILHILNHSIFKTLLFYGAGAVYSKTHTKDIEELGGLMKKMPYTGVLFLIGSIAIAGLPPFNGFISEIFIYASMLKALPSSDIASFIIIILSLSSLALVGTMAILCFTKVIGVMFLGAPRSENAKKVNEDVSFVMIIPMAILALLCLLIGIFPEAGLKMVLSPIDSLTMGFIDSIYIMKLTELSKTLSFSFFIFFIILTLVSILRISLNRKHSTHTTWGCGYDRVNERMQYTASSYADLFISTLKPLFKRIPHIKKPKTLFPKEAYYEVEIEDIEEAYILKPLVKLDERILSKFERIQNGNMQQYILFGLIFLVLSIIGLLYLG